MLYCFYTPKYKKYLKKNNYIKETKNKFIYRLNHDLKLFPLSKLTIIFKFFKHFLNLKIEKNFEYIDIDLELKINFSEFNNYIYYEILDNPIKRVPHFFYLKLDKKFLSQNFFYFENIYNKIKKNYLNKKIKWNWFYEHCDEYFLIFVIKKLKNTEDFQQIEKFNLENNFQKIYQNLN